MFSKPAYFPAMSTLYAGSPPLRGPSLAAPSIMISQPAPKQPHPPPQQQRLQKQPKKPDPCEIAKDNFLKWQAAFAGPENFKVDSTMSEMRSILYALQEQPNGGCVYMLRALERMYIALIGHRLDQVRDAAIADLNTLYDGHSLQATEALPVAIAAVGESPLVSVVHRAHDHGVFDADALLHRQVVLRVIGPDGSANEYPLALLEGGRAVEARIPPFEKPGFYDWIVAEPGMNVHAPLEVLPVDSARRLRGRFIVHPKDARQTTIVEMPVDEVDAVWDENTGQLQTRGSFESVSKNLEEVKAHGASAVYLMGALQRPLDEPDASPFSIVDRKCPARMLGGATEFKNLVSEIRRLGMTPIIDAVDRISRNRMHRKYRDLSVETLDYRGIPLRHPGTDGRQNQWEDTALLNYRKKEAWDIFVDEIKFMAAHYGIRGIRLDNAQSFPPIMEPNDEELFRRDTDGEYHYTKEEMFFGTVVKSNHEHGYWTSEACLERNYPNPFLIRLCKEMWKDYPDFLIIAEAHFHREASLLTSGAIPHSIRIPQILASMSGNSLRRDGTVTRLPENKRSKARTLSRLYRNDKVWLPKNSIMVNCTCTHMSPYPGVLYGRRSWLAVDMLMLLPDVPMLLYGEERGRAHRVNMATVSTHEEVTEYDVNFDDILPKSPQNRSAHTSPADGVIPTLALPAAGMTLRNTNKSTGEVSKLPTTPPGMPSPGGLRKTRLKRKGSLADLRRVPSNSSLVRSRSRDDMKGISVRSMSVDDLRRLSEREEQTRQEIGPATGFDLAQIKGHYTHRLLLRQEMEALRRGGICVLSVEPQLKDQVFAFSRFSENQIVLCALNFRDSRDGHQHAQGCHVDLDLRPLWDHLPDCYVKGTAPSAFYSIVDTFTNAEISSDIYTLEELAFRKCNVHIGPLGTVLLTLKRLDDSPQRRALHLSQCLHRLQAVEAADIKDPRENDLISRIARGAASSASDFASAINTLRLGLMNEGCDTYTVQRVLQLCIQRASQLLFIVSYEGAPAPKDFEPPAAEKIVAYLTHISTAARDEELLRITRDIVSKSTKLGPLVFLTAELGRFSTAGGLGVMVDELTKGLANLGLEVYVVSPYYTVNRKNQAGYLGDHIRWTRNMNVNLGTHVVEVGVFEGKEHGVNLIFLERGDVFPKVYASTGGATQHLQAVVLLSLGSLEVCCQKSLVPSLVVSNDWLPSLAPGYRDFFGDYFNNTSFFHLIHNLGEGAYEGRCYPNPGEGALEHVHRLPRHHLVNPWWNNVVVNPSRCALMRCDSWGTVSPSYLKELLGGHPLSDLLQMAKSPFAYPNGIRQAEREIALAEQGGGNHAAAKEKLQKTYFGFENGDPSIPLFAFVGRITSQKGVHLILNAVDELVSYTGGKIQILVGGPANYSDPYSANCARHMHDLRRRHPWCFWAAPDEFFTDGPTLNLGADFGLMPSLFEPGGIVQQEFFVAGTPVVAYKTGGLKDTVHEWKSEEGEGNGFTFEEYSHGDFVWAVKRALRVFAQTEEYEELRGSAYETTIDVSQVSWAWSSEFHRLRNAMYTRGDVVSALISETVGEKSSLFDSNARPAVISWNGPGSTITLKGSFDGWNAEWALNAERGDEPVQNGAEERDEPKAHKITLRLMPGEYTYKFKVDGVWTVAEDQPQQQDGAGFINNVVHVY